MDTSNLKELYCALAAVQAKLAPVRKNANNSFFSSKYATLAAVFAEVQPVLQENGLMVYQRHVPTPDNAVTSVMLETTLVHLETGQSLSSTIVIPCVNTAHGIGSATTYARRYALTTLIGAIVDDDDDGNSTMEHQAQPQNRPKQNAPQRAKTNEAPRSTPPRANATKPTPTGQDARKQAAMPMLSGVSYSERKNSEGRMFVIASGNTQKHSPILQTAGFRYHPEKRLWWRYFE